MLGQTILDTVYPIPDGFCIELDNAKGERKFIQAKTRECFQKCQEGTKCSEERLTQAESSHGQGGKRCMKDKHRHYLQHKDGATMENLCSKN